MRRVKHPMRRWRCCSPSSLSPAPAAAWSAAGEVGDGVPAAAISLAEARLGAADAVAAEFDVLTSRSASSGFGDAGPGRAGGPPRQTWPPGSASRRQGMTLGGMRPGLCGLRQRLTTCRRDVRVGERGLGDKVGEPEPGFAQAGPGLSPRRIVGADLAATSGAGSINGFVSSATRGETPQSCRASHRTPRSFWSTPSISRALAVRFETGDTENEPSPPPTGERSRPRRCNRQASSRYYETAGFQSGSRCRTKGPRFELVLMLTRPTGAMPAAGWTAALASRTSQPSEGSWPFQAGYHLGGRSRRRPCAPRASMSRSVRRPTMARWPTARLR